MRLTWLSHRDLRHPRAGGAERTAFEISKRLVSMGDSVELVTCAYPGSPRSATLEGVRIRRIGGPIATHLATLARLTLRHSDIVVDDLAHVLPWTGDFGHSLPGIAFFHHLHRRTLRGQVSWPISSALIEIERLYPQIYSHWPFITESRASEQDLRDLGIPDSRITRINPGVDLQAFRPLDKFSDPTLVFFSGLRAYKQPEVALEVFSRLRRDFSGLKIYVVGEFSKRSVSKDSMGFKSIPGVVFPGRLGDRELATIVGRSWANINCSTAEGWGFSILEASAAGTPTAAFDVPGVSEAVVNGVNGLRVAPGDISALVAACRTLLDSTRRFSLTSREYARGFSWDESARLWKYSLEQLLDSGPRIGASTVSA